MIFGPDKQSNIGFRAWHQGEFGDTYLVTGWLKGSHFKKFKGEQLMTILTNYNHLKGKVAGIKITDSEEGCLMRFFANPEMWADLLQQRKNETDRRVRLNIGWDPIDFSLQMKRKQTENTSGGDKLQGQGREVTALAEAAAVTEPEAESSSKNA